MLLVVAVAGKINQHDEALLSLHADDACTYTNYSAVELKSLMIAMTMAKIRKHKLIVKPIIITRTEQEFLLTIIVTTGVNGAKANNSENEGASNNSNYIVITITAGSCNSKQPMGNDAQLTAHDL